MRLKGALYQGDLCNRISTEKNSLTILKGENVANLETKKAKTKSNVSLYSLHSAETCNELTGPISASFHPGNTTPFEDMS